MNVRWLVLIALTLILGFLMEARGEETKKACPPGAMCSEDMRVIHSCIGCVQGGTWTMQPEPRKDGFLGPPHPIPGPEKIPGPKKNGEIPPKSE